MINKYKAKAVITAECFSLKADKFPKGVVPFSAVLPTQYVLPMEYSFFYLNEGDYVCTGEDGTRWGMKAAEFEKTYEKVTGDGEFFLDNSKLDR